jgi:dodecin
MSVARVTEISARSTQSFEDAVQKGIERANSTLRNVEGAWIKEQEVKISDGQIQSYEVTMKITFVLE